MSRREYRIEILFNGIEIKKVIIDPHYEKKHSATVSDEVILNLVQRLDGLRLDPVRIRDLFSYFVRDRIEMEGKFYKLIWLLKEDGETYIGVVNAYRR